MSEWLYKGKKLAKVPKGAYGFTYVISYTQKNNPDLDWGKFYIGKKVLQFSKKKRLTKKEKLLPENKRKRFKIDTQESDWKEYWGSSILLLKDIEKYGKENFIRRILNFYPDKINLTYAEMKEQFSLDVLNRNTYNVSIGGKFFKGKIK